jgi:hypothetical protein
VVVVAVALDDVVLVAVADPVAVLVGLDDLVGFGDVVDLAVLVGAGSTVGLGTVDDGSTVLGDGLGVVLCAVLCTDVDADEPRCCTVLFPTCPLDWPVR